LNYSSINSIPWGEGTDILVSSVKAVPEPSSFILVVISGIALLVLKKKPLRSS